MRLRRLQRHLPAARVRTELSGWQLLWSRGGLWVEDVHEREVRAPGVRSGVQRRELVRGCGGLWVQGLHGRDLSEAGVLARVQHREPVRGKRGLYVDELHERDLRVVPGGGRDRPHPGSPTNQRRPDRAVTAPEFSRVAVAPVARQRDFAVRMRRDRSRSEGTHPA